MMANPMMTRATRVVAPKVMAVHMMAMGMVSPHVAPAVAQAPTVQRVPSVCVAAGMAPVPDVMAMDVPAVRVVASEHAMVAHSVVNALMAAVTAPPQVVELVARAPRVASDVAVGPVVAYPVMPRVRRVLAAMGVVGCVQVSACLTMDPMG